MDVGKTKEMRISRQQSTVQTMINQNQLENGEYFNCLGSMINKSCKMYKWD
jgi:hypothetical protein